MWDLFTSWVGYPLLFAWLFYAVFSMLGLGINWLTENILLSKNINFGWKCLIAYGIGLFITYQFGMLF